MLQKRVIVCLDVKDGRVVKGVQFQDLRDVGDPAELAARYETEGADEVVFLDISASEEGRRTLLDVVQRTAERLFIPLTVGGGVGDVDDVARLLRAGADKVSINSASIERPELLSEARDRFGAQCVVASIDAKLERRRGEASSDLLAGRGAYDEAGDLEWYRVFTHGGKRPTNRNALAWAQQCVQLGAGEILLTSIDNDGMRDGFDLELTARVAERVPVPVIASGGAGSWEHMRDAFVIAGADAALAAGIYHDGVTTVHEVKRHLVEAGIHIRTQRPEEQTGPTGAEPTPQPG